MPYIHEVFLPQTIDAAKQAALSADPADPQKFEKETQFLVDFLKEKNLIPPGTQVLDFGCGMGRVSRALALEGCAVEAVDYSPAMRHFAAWYLQGTSARVIEQPEATAHVAVAAFVLQHVEYPEREVEAIASHVKPGGTLALLNEHKRFVPSGVDAQGFVIWKDDGISIPALVAEYFAPAGVFDYYKRTDKPLSLWLRK